MSKLNRTVTPFVLTLLFAGLVAIAGCSSSPDEAQMKQMNDLKEEVTALQRDVAAKEQQKAGLESSIAEKNAMMKKCNDDQAIVKQRLAK